MTQLLNLLQLDPAHIEVRPEWNSQTPNCRTLLRQALWQKAKSQRPELTNDHQIKTQDLNRVPQFPGLSSSIAHCPLAGGFVLSASPQAQLGFDLEDETRAQPQVVLRMSSPQELSQAPGPAHLWVAKEATFKSLLGPLQPQVLSQIVIVDWRAQSDEAWTFHVQIQPHPGLKVAGAILQKEHLILGLSRFSA